jgi:hypothetical protein
MRHEFHPHAHDDLAWTRQETALLGAFVLGGVIFFGAMFYALGFWRESAQVAGVIPPAVTGERVPVIPHLK